MTREQAEDLKQSRHKPNKSFNATCRACRGTGRDPGTQDNCQACDGHGWVASNRHDEGFIATLALHGSVTIDRPARGLSPVWRVVVHRHGKVATQAEGATLIEAVVRAYRSLFGDEAG